MTILRWIALAVSTLVVLAGVAVLAVTSIGGFRGTTVGDSAAQPSTRVAPRAATTTDQLGGAFLGDYVTGGRVIRHDQGNDTVSEGQAYGLLIALGINDRTTFDSIWTWTKKNLMKRDGLLAWRFDGGKIVDDQPASDADLDAARALVLAGAAFDEPSLTTAGNALGSHILDQLTVSTAVGRILLPGKWAASTEPYTYNPSYSSPVSYAVLGKSSKDPRWAELAKGSAAVSKKLLSSTALPPDWAQVAMDGTVQPSIAPNDPSTGVRYGFDAARLVLRYAESCTSGDRAISAGLATTLSRSQTLPLDLGGGRLGGVRSPIANGAAAAAAAAAGDSARAKSQLAASAELISSTHTYYGSAWAALAPLMLETRTLGGCAPIKEN